MQPPNVCFFARDTYIVKMDLNSGQLVIAGRDNAPINAAEVEAVLGEREPAVIWNQSDKHGFLVFGPNFDGESLAQLLCDQLNACNAEDDTLLCDQLNACATEDEARDAELIDAAAEVAEAAEAADGLTATQRRGIAAYQRAAALPPFPYSAACGTQHQVGDRVRIGTAGDRYEYGVYSALVPTANAFGALATVILPARPGCPLVVITDDDDILALPLPGLYVRPVTESAQ